MSVKDTDRGYRELVKRAQLSGQILVGIFAEEGEKEYEAGTSVLDVAFWNEFGTEKIPARSFLRAWFDENQDKIREAVKRMAEAVLKGRYTARQAKELLAQTFVAQIQRRIAIGIPPPNAPATVTRKGSSTPLIDTGQLRSSITYKVES